MYTDDYLTARSRFGPDTTDPIVVAIARAAAVRRLEVIERAVPVGTLLDVGCGSGEALDVAAERGWTAVGVEPIKASAERARARGHDVRVGTVDGADLPRGGFDAVVASHVLEHVPNPVQFLQALAKQARPGGVLAVEVPNWLHRIRRKAGADWDQLCPLEHVTHFTPGTLRRTMRRAGLRARSTTVTVVRSSPVIDRLGRGFAVLAVATVERYGAM